MGAVRHLFQLYLVKHSVVMVHGLLCLFMVRGAWSVFDLLLVSAALLRLAQTKRLSG